MAFQEKYTTEQNKPMQTSVDPDNQDYWYYCSHSYTADNVDKENKYRYNKDKKHMKKMDSLMCNSMEMLREYFDPKLYPNHQLPFDLFQTCKGIIFLRIWKAGIFLGGIGGTGIVLAHRNGSWSHPCALTFGGIQLGLQLGIERVDDILLLRDEEALRLFMEKGHFKLGVDASIALGNYGRDANTGIVLSGNESKSIYAYSFAKGAFIGLSLDGGTLSIDHSVNEEFYGRKVTVKDIFYGDALPVNDNEFKSLLDTLNNCCCVTQSQNININENRNIQNVTPVI
jgi:lipid-binding SYLF domain-containing protein